MLIDIQIKFEIGTETTDYLTRLMSSFDDYQNHE